MPSRWPALLWACLLASCASGSGGAPQQPWGFGAGQACVSTGECRQGLECDPRRKVCVCTSDESCPAGLSCHPISGGCVANAPGCAADGDCRQGEYCEAGTCRQAHAYCEPCERNEHCEGATSVCHPEGFCGAPCGVDADCGPRSRCQRGQCAPALRCVELTGKETGHCLGSCMTDEDCPMPGDRCEHRRCRPAIGCADLEPCTPDTLVACTRHADCVEGADQICVAGLCVARHSGCAHSEACDPLTLACAPSCAADLDCRPGTTCVAGACRPVERCQSHGDCPKGKVCACPKGKTCSFPDDWGECRPGCAGNEDCPLRMVCVQEFDRRVCKPGCASDRDCGAGERCDARTALCSSEGRACQIDEVCATCEFCVEGRCTPARSPATPFCQRCWDDSTCGEGGVCWRGNCAPSCADVGCPSGFSCERLGEGGPLGCLPMDGVCDTECL